MIDWGELFEGVETGKEPQINPKSGEIPQSKPANSGRVGKLKPSIANGFKAISPHSPLSPPVFEGVGIKQEKTSPVSGVATVNLRDEKTYKPHPIAALLLFACCLRIRATKAEFFEQFIKLRTMTPNDQIKSWTILCEAEGIDTTKVIWPYIESANSANGCGNGQHIDMKTEHRPGSRRKFHWRCKQGHGILEINLAGERILAAPEECSDYSPPS